MNFPDIFCRLLRVGSAGQTRIRTGTGSPEGVVTGAIGDLFLRTNGGIGSTLYVKESGSSTTGWAAGGGGVIRSTTTTLTDAQIKALPTTAIAVVAAPGASLYVHPISAVLFSKTTAGAYTNINAGANLGFEFATTGVEPLGYVPNDAVITNGSVTRLTDFLGAAANRRITVLPKVASENVNEWGVIDSSVASADGTNQALNLYLYNVAAGNLTGGNAANTLSVVVLYALVTVP